MMGVQASLCVLLLFISAVTAADGGVRFSGEHFTMTCPGKGTWSHKQKEIQTGGTEAKALKVKYSGITKGSYYCEYKKEDDAAGTDGAATEKYYFYVKGKVCPTCVELDASLFGGVIAVDLVVTTVLMIIIFMCTKKKRSAGRPQSKAAARSGGRAPPVQSPHYEPLSAHTRAQDPYSLVHRMG